MSIKDYDNRHNQGGIVLLSNEKTHIYAYENLTGVQDEFCVYKDDEKLGEYALCCKGEHNKNNALFAIAVCDLLGISFDDMETALASFSGVERRFETVGEIDGVKVVFDYAHHPTEIENAIKTAKTFGRVLAVFQPHTFSRTKAYASGFVKALSIADGVIVTSTYPAREKESDGMTSECLFSMFEKESKDKCVCDVVGLDGIENVVFSVAKNYDVVLFLGAGDIYSLKNDFVK